MNVATVDQQQERPAWGRGGLPKNDSVTPRSSDDVTRSKITVRDGALVLIGALSMFGVQLGTQWGMRSDIRDLATATRETSTHLQYQIDENRRSQASNQIRLEEQAKELAQLKGILIGAGIKGIDGK